MSRNLDVFYNLVGRDCNSSSVYFRYLDRPEEVYLSKKFGISVAKARRYLQEFKKEKASEAEAQEA